MHASDTTRQAIVSLAALLLSCGAAVSAPIATPDFARMPALDLRMVSARTGNVIQTSRIWSEPIVRRGEPLIVLHERAALQTGRTLESQMLLQPGATLRCLEEEHRVQGDDGEILATTMRQFRPDALLFQGLPVPDDTYPLSGSLLYLLGYLPLDADGEGSFHLLGPMQAFKLNARRHGSEDISVPAGHFACNHLRLQPDAESLNLPAVFRPFARLLLPEFNAWIMRDPPHLTVRATGPFGAPEDRDVILEVVAIEPVPQAAESPGVGTIQP